MVMIKTLHDVSITSCHPHKHTPGIHSSSFYLHKIYVNFFIFDNDVKKSTKCRVTFLYYDNFVKSILK